MSTISVLKDVLSKEATQKKITVEMSHGMTYACIMCIYSAMYFFPYRTWRQVNTSYVRVNISQTGGPGYASKKCSTDRCFTGVRYVINNFLQMVSVSLTCVLNFSLIFRSWRSMSKTHPSCLLIVSSFLVWVCHCVTHHDWMCLCVENAELMKEDFKQQPCMVDRLYGMQSKYSNRVNI